MLAGADRGQAEESRKWSDAGGTYSVVAEFVELKDGVVRLRREDGRIARIPLDRLSEADQRYVRQKMTGRPDAAPPFQDEPSAGGPATPPADGGGM